MTATGSVGRPGSAGRLAALLAVGLGLLAVSSAVLVHTRAGQWVDNWGFEGRKATSFEARRALRFGLRWLTPPVVVLATACAAAVCLRRRHWRLAVAASAAVAGAWLSAAWLKSTLDRPRLLDTYAGPANTFPSGHILLVVTTTLVAVMVALPHRRTLVATIGAVVAAGYVVALLSIGWHRPSDALGAIGLALAWAAVAALAGGAHRLTVPLTDVARAPVDLPSPTLLVVMVDAVVAASIVVFRTTVEGPTRPLLSFVLAAVTLATVTVVVVRSFAWAVGSSA